MSCHDLFRSWKILHPMSLRSGTAASPVVLVQVGSKFAGGHEILLLALADSVASKLSIYQSIITFYVFFYSRL